MRGLKTHQELPTDWNEREKLRNKGQFWTPAWVAQAMVSYVAQSTILIFDPATGRGSFFDALRRLNRPEISYFGTDVDPEVLTDEIYNSSNCHVELRDFIKNPPQRKFRGIVANPPYIRHHRIDEGTKVFLKQLCARITGFVIDGRAGYHIYFLLQALQHLETDGKLAFIMPADTCEGTFEKKLWQWISNKYCIECVVTFEEKATPFPDVDTNALIFLIKKAKPKGNFFWVKVNQAYCDDLLQFISSGFETQELKTIEITKRGLEEALKTGLSRPEQAPNGFTFHLNDFAKIMRGIATGSNEFFFLTRQQVKEFEIPDEFLKVAIGRTRDVDGSIITLEDIRLLEDKGRPTFLFSINGHSVLPEAISKYLRVGEELGLPNRPLIKQRKPWYKMEERKVPPLLFAYLGRRNTRFIKNEAGVLPLTGFLCVYPISNDNEYIDSLWQALNHPDTLNNLKLVGKSYGSGALKVEPRNLDKLPIPDHIVEQFNLIRPRNTFSEQMNYLTKY